MVPCMPENGLQLWYLSSVISLTAGIDRIYVIQVVEYIAFELLSNYGKDNEIKEIVDTQDFYIFPVVNPDGE